MTPDLSRLKRADLDALKAELTAILNHLSYPLAATLPHIESYETAQATKRTRRLLAAVNECIAEYERTIPTQPDIDVFVLADVTAA